MAGGAPGGPRRRRSAVADPRPTALLELDLGAGAFELLLGLVGVLLGDVLEDGLRSRLDELLRLLEPEAREAADLLDDLDLLVPGRGEDDVELVLLLGGAVTGGGPRGGGPRGHRHGRGGGHADLLPAAPPALVPAAAARVLD